MANSIIKKTLLVKGDAGEQGDAGTDITLPINGLVFFEGEEIPEGYELYKDLEGANE